MKKQFAIIGLGRFGGSICRALNEQGLEVLAIDTSEEKVNEFASVATHAVIADATEEMTLKSLGIRNFDHVVVAIGDNIQSSILTTLMLVEQGVNHITVKAQNDYHEKVLNKIGAHKVVHPERDMGVRIAHNVVSKNVLDYLELSNEYSIVELEAGKLVDKRSLTDLDLRLKYGCNVMAIKREDDVNVSPAPDDILLEGDIIIVVGADSDINRMEEALFDDN
ncbi:potassium channel family protein [Salisediminibacterium halotolerans]|uniref:Trk system potassium uptake protein TrkA n=1 Tax=Salisediminibacterium halotolerans TaxID=517425 RepID=A0A1H9WLX9_9BACI|nr:MULTISPECIES: TrkA family potassium uptake protein [Salisediminibacterium]RLJ74367.1 trk system potassium uptake protein TrkA [Actinophytocola xinjiangensis]RPE87540.1 trk system potassium uptake protein TrkA [Salisediminibacterium halotolerans]TWG35204.1 trk system potassium uptake protein TrkA [Salisediminibacterium halotolerans]SES34922.1 trk system potassium uptake protein TrkA [Salisediminibacterium haloalkalitolerans]GEL08164.1 potassium transporter Trk [Salisediminibacterium halotole